PSASRADEAALRAVDSAAKKKARRSPDRRAVGMVEAAGIEPASESALLVGPTCVAFVFYSAGAPEGRRTGRGPRLLRTVLARGDSDGPARINDAGDGRLWRATGLRAVQTAD